MPEPMAEESENLRRLYASRFEDMHEARGPLWEVLSRHFFQRYVPENGTVLEVAAGYCEFINTVRARRRIAIDLNPDLPNRAAAGVETVVCSATDMSMIDDDTADVAFVSNFFEHITKPDIIATMVEIRRVLKPTGKLLVLQPNIQFCGKQYWMFFDHITPLDHHSLAEALNLAGFSVQESIPRFLPFTTKSRLPSWPWLVRTYLFLRPAWRVFGKMSFVVAVCETPRRISS
jgi:ubiquinone/menaquinone biosynthesis C-methylase UbiE